MIGEPGYGGGVFGSGGEFSWQRAGWCYWNNGTIGSEWRWSAALCRVFGFELDIEVEGGDDFEEGSDGSIVDAVFQPGYGGLAHTDNGGKLSLTEVQLITTPDQGLDQLITITRT